LLHRLQGSQESGSHAESAFERRQPFTDFHSFVDPLVRVRDLVSQTDETVLHPFFEQVKTGLSTFIQMVKRLLKSPLEGGRAFADARFQGAHLITQAI
jgi:hypothetical protein